MISNLKARKKNRVGKSRIYIYFVSFFVGCSLQTIAFIYFFPFEKHWFCFPIFIFIVRRRFFFFNSPLLCVFHVFIPHENVNKKKTKLNKFSWNMALKSIFFMYSCFCFKFNRNSLNRLSSNLFIKEKGFINL